MGFLMARKIVVSETDLDKIKQEPGDFIPKDKYEEWDEFGETIKSKRKRKFGKDGEYASRRHLVP